MRDKDKNQNKEIPIAANFYKADPMPSIEVCIDRLNTTCRTSELNSLDIKRELTVLESVQTRVEFDETLSDKQINKFKRQLDLIEKIFRSNLQKTQRQEYLEDQERVREGLEPLHRMTSKKRRYLDKIVDDILGQNTRQPSQQATPGGKAVQNKNATSRKEGLTHYTIENVSKGPTAESTIMKLLEEMEITEDGQCIVLRGRGTTYFATIDAVSEKYQSLLKKKYRVAQLLDAFNTTLGLSFSQFKRSGKDFEKKKTSAIAHLNKIQKLTKE